MTIREIALAVLTGEVHLDALDPSTRKSVIVEMTVVEAEKASEPAQTKKAK